MTTELATVHQLPWTIELSNQDREAAEAVASVLRDAKSENTRRAYVSAWHRFQEWGRRRPLGTPATPQAVALYPGHLAATGQLASIEQARGAISHFHVQKADNPTRHPVVAEALRSRRNRAPAPRQVDVLTDGTLARVREVLRALRRGRGARLESAETAKRRAALGPAVIGVLAMAASGGRRPPI